MYNVKLSLTVQEDIEKIENHYFKISPKIADKLIVNIRKLYATLSINPFFKVKHKNYRSISIENFPYLLFFEIDENSKTVYILSCFNTSQNPNNYPI